MGDENQPQPEKKLGSQEAGLRETPGSGVTMPQWAQSLEHDIKPILPKVKIDLVKRMIEAEEERLAHERAARLAAEKARAAEAKAKAAAGAVAHTAARAAAHLPHHTPPLQHRRARPPDRLSRWPAILAAAGVILIGALVGMLWISSGEPPPEIPAASASTIPLPENTVSPFARIYTVQSGDTLEEIARDNETTPEDISRANGSNDQLIEVRPGQRINIP